jgi:hypothetical protein
MSLRMTSATTPMGSASARKNASLLTVSSSGLSSSEKVLSIPAEVTPANPWTRCCSMHKAI